MSASAIGDALVSILGAASAFGPGSVATHYGVLESSSGSAVVIQWTGIESHKDQFGQATNERNWIMTLDMFAKDLGDPIALSNKLSSCIDILLTTMESNNTINATAEWTGAIRANRPMPPEGIFEAGGATWFRMPVEIDVREWPNG